MALILRNSYFKVSNGYFVSIEAITPPLPIGEFYRVVNIDSSNSGNFLYTNLLGQSENIPLNAGQIGYIQAASQSYNDSQTVLTGIFGASAIITRLLITSSVYEPTVTFTEQLITTTGAGTWTKPVGVTQVIVECWGAGGAGGGATGNPAAGGGGGGGQYSRKYLQYSSPSVGISYSVGAGGVGTQTTVVNGGDTTWNTTDVIAKGGTGGTPNATTEGVPAAGGVGNTAGSVGDVIYFGGDANPGEIIGASSNSGTGGFAAGSIASGGPIFFGFSSQEYGGSGGGGQSDSSVAGVPGTNYGGGGGGAVTNISTNRAGGNGAQGLIRIIYKPSGLLTLDAYTGSNAAYSIRKLSSTATASMQVQRSNDNAVLDIGFQANGMLDTGSLLTFVGSNTGYVKYWYDQTGGNHRFEPFNASPTTWPIIVTAGTLETTNGKPAIKFNAGQTLIIAIPDQQYTDAGGLWYQFAVAQSADATTRVLTKIGNATNIAQSIRRGTTALEAIGYNTAAGTGTDTNGVSPGTAQFLAYVQRTTTGIEIYMNGASNGATAITGTPQTEASSNMTLGSFNPSTISFPWSGTVQEIIHYPQSSVTFDYRAALTAEIDTYYGTF